MTMGYKLFTLHEARKQLPGLRRLFADANRELLEKQEVLRAANERYDEAERAVDALDGGTDFPSLRAARRRFQEAIYELSSTQNAYLSRLNYWVDAITATGVVLRDLREGLLDFPCRDGEFEYLLCWRVDEDDIGFWHLESDGFIGRKPLSVLTEYL